jgi:ADP-heptose:LPS heptosyltransferase
MSEVRKPKLLVIELWGLGDLLLAAPFLEAASHRFEVTLLAKPHATVVGSQFFPLAKVITFIAPWTAFRHKYRLYSWPWRRLFRLRQLRSESFEFGASGRWDPRDHLLLRALCGGKRLGFPRLGSQLLLTNPLTRPAPLAHRYEQWRAIGLALNLELPARGELRMPIRQPREEILIHTGASQKVKVWPLDRYQRLVTRLRRENYQVQVACNPDQRAWWESVGETNVVASATVGELFAIVQRAGAFIGNDSGPGHLAALSGVPTFTLFGSGLSEWFAPLHPASEWLDGKPCPYKPCRDYCRFPTPHCLWDLDEELVWSRVEKFVSRHIRKHSDFSPSTSTPSTF